MDTTTLKNFAQTARRQLLEQVSARLEFVLGTDSAELREKESAVAELKTQINKFSKEAVIDKVAYTWFNRFCALRFMDVNGYTTMGTVSPADGHTLPQVLAEAKQGHIDETFDPYLNKKRVMDLLMGKVTSRDPQGEAYRHLLVAVCNYYHAAMPFLFEKIQDYTELLMPEDLLSDNSVLSAVKKALTPAACENVEVIGWLYQFYISERKDEVMARKSAVPTEDIPAVTQLFTPHWIVRYLVENSLGRLWLLNRPNSKLREHMPYYIEGEAEADFLKITKPEDIRLLDPACGSGHMLTYAFDLLYRIYEEEGYAPSEIPAFILQHNLHGLEICPRAAQLAQFALVCKAREKSRSAFRSPIQPQVMCLEDVVFVDGELAEYLKRCDLNEVFTDKVLEQGHQFRNMATFGSLLQPVLTVAEITDVQSRVKRVDPDNDLFLSETHKKVKCALDQAEMLSQRYHVVIANPPYMGTKAMNLVLKSYVNDVFSDGKADLYSVFMQRNSSLTLKGGYFAMITIPNWMFISSFEELRNRILRECYITTLIHNGRGVWGGDFGSCAFVIKNQQSSNRPGAYRRLFQKQGEIQSNSEIENNFFNLNVFPVFLASAEDFRKIPGSPIAYFTTDNVLSAFTNNKSLEDHGLVRQGASTSDNDRFLRLWFEITHSKIGFGIVDLDDASRSGLKWFPYNKGGSFRKWYGNQDFLINYENDGMELKEFQSTLNYSVLKKLDRKI